MKKLIFSFVLLLLSIIMKPAFAQFTQCSTTGASQGSPISNTTDCFTQPDIQQVTFYKIALCRAQPVAPTALTPINTSSCTTVLENASGSTINIQRNVLVNLVGQTTKPENGVYSYLYIEIDPVMKVQKTAYFSTVRNNTNSSSSGTKCWSLPVNTYANSGGSNPVATSCAADNATTSGIGLTSIINNSLDGGSGFVGTRVFPTTNGPSLTAHLIDSTGKIGTAGVNSLGTVTKIAAYMPQSINMTQSNLLSQIDIFYGNLTGTNISMGGGVVAVFSGGPINPYLGFKF
jgi:hypothetical protein